MMLQTARFTLVRDRMDWKRPHLPWVPKSLYSRVLRRRNPS